MGPHWVCQDLNTPDHYKHIKLKSASSSCRSTVCQLEYLICNKRGVNKTHLRNGKSDYKWHFGPYSNVTVQDRVWKSPSAHFLCLYWLLAHSLLNICRCLGITPFPQIVCPQFDSVLFYCLMTWKF